MVQRLCLMVLAYTGVLLLIGFSIQAQEKESTTKGKAPWEWTTEERLAERYDPVRVEERRQRAVDKALQEDPRVYDRPALHDPLRAVIDGDETPELILPWELFDSLMHRAFLADPEFCRYYRERAQERAGAFGKRDDLWPMLEKIGSAFIDFNLEMQVIGDDPAYHDPNSSQHQELREAYESLGLQSCRARFEALNTSREYFGETEFGRFLYDAIAPEFKVSYDWDGKGTGKIKTKRWAAGGCQ